MTAQEKSGPESKHACDLILSRINEALSDVTRNQAEKVCSIGISTRFAYCYHRRSGLRIYLRGKESDGPQLNALVEGGRSIVVTKRSAMGSPWAKLTPYFLDIDSEAGALAAIPLLLHSAAGIKERSKPSAYLFPSELSAIEMFEGARFTVQVSRIERDPAARRECVRIFGAACMVCGFDFQDRYGEIGSGFIHVHHINPLAASQGRR